MLRGNVYTSWFRPRPVQRSFQLKLCDHLRNGFRTSSRAGSSDEIVWHRTMFSLFSFVVYHGALSFLFASARLCNPANYICSGRCPDIPPKVQLPNGVAICMKDSLTGACVCWLKGDSNHVHSWFRCEAMINGSVTEIGCQTPTHCFPPDSEPTCLILPYCDCQLIRDGDSPEFQFGNWKPVKAIVELSEHSAKYPKDIREFSLKHLLFLLGFVIAPLACWCLLNFINENKCKRKDINSNQERTPISTERGRTIDRHVSQDTAGRSLASDSETLTNESSSDSCQNSPIRTSFCLPFQASSVVSSVTSPLNKQESPPSYDEVVSPDLELDDEGPPPSYADAMQGHELSVQEVLQTMLVVHVGSCEQV